jgi:hypothetical protein
MALSSELFLQFQGLINSTSKYSQSFTQPDLSVANTLTVTHSLKSPRVEIKVWNKNHEEIRPDFAHAVGIDFAVIGMDTFAPLDGPFFVQITKVD